MFNEFCKEVGKNIAEEWIGHIISPAFAFWGIGLLIWIYKNGWIPVIEFLKTANAAMGLAVIIGGLFVIILSYKFVELITLPVLRLVEGYLPKPFKMLKFWLINQIVIKRLIEKEKKWGKLAEKFREGNLDAKSKEEYTQLDGELSNYPNDKDLILPFRLGNILRSAEEYPGIRYGLDIMVVWPRFWFVLPESTQKELVSARKRLDEGVQLMIWGFLLLIWIIWLKWIILIALVVVITSHLRMVNAAKVYSQILRSVFDLYRFDLYKALNWPFPVKPDKEFEHGQNLTLYLNRGIPPKNNKFKFADK